MLHFWHCCQRGRLNSRNWSTIAINKRKNSSSRGSEGESNRSHWYRGSNSRRKLRKDTIAKREKKNRGFSLYQQKREICYKEGDMEWICKDNKFSIWHINLIVTKLIIITNWSVWFAINAKEGDCWKWLKRSLIEEW